MKILRVKMFNRKASDPRYKPDQVIRSISIKPGMHIADIGSGGGYYSMRFAGIVGNNGRVYAVDNNEDYLNFISSSASRKSLNNIVTVSSSDQWVKIPEENIDCIFMRNVTHHISGRSNYFRRLKKYLKSGGRIVIIDYKKQKKRILWRASSHYVDRETLIEEMADAGYRIEKEFDFLPQQNFIIFKPE